MNVAAGSDDRICLDARRMLNEYVDYYDDHFFFSPFLVSRFQWSDGSNSGILLRYVITGVKFELRKGFPLMYCTRRDCRLLLKTRPQWSEIQNRGLFWWYLGFFPKYHRKSYSPMTRMTAKLC